jgi:phosphatidylserine/phosphatidylglycerophosphate/cardiolipin synthase-like enzyme
MNNKPSPDNNIDALIKIFEKTFEDKNFSRSEKQAVMRLMFEDYCLDKDQRDVVRSKLFDLARTGISGHKNLNVLDWLETANKLLLNRQDSRVYFSPGDECRDLIIEHLKCATQSVDICVYTISDDEISNTITACHRRKIKVRIITDDEKVNDRGSDIWEMAVRGIETKIDNSPHYMHHKFAVFDNQMVLTGSYNWTRGAAEFNQENLLFTDDQRAVAAYRQEFQRLWEDMDYLPLPGRHR